MVAENLINTTEIGGNILQGLSPFFSPLITILKAIGIVVIIYIIFLIIKSILSWRDHSRLKKIAQNVEQINEKFDSLLRKKSSVRKESSKKSFKKK